MILKYSCWGRRIRTGYIEISCSADRTADPMYHPKQGESFALTAVAEKSFTYEGKKLWRERMGHAYHKVVAELGRTEKAGANLNPLQMK
jgi:hypothetical protein